MFKSLISTKELKKAFKIFEKDYTIEVSTDPRKEIDISSTTKVDEFKVYKKTRKTAKITNYELFFIRAKAKKVNKTYLKSISKNLDLTHIFDDKKMEKSLIDLYKKAYLKNQKQRHKKDKQAPVGVWSGQLLSSFFASRGKK